MPCLHVLFLPSVFQTVQSLPHPLHTTRMPANHLQHQTLLHTSTMHCHMPYNKSIPVRGSSGYICCSMAVLMRLIALPHNLQMVNFVERILYPVSCDDVRSVDVDFCRLPFRSIIRQEVHPTFVLGRYGNEQYCRYSLFRLHRPDPPLGIPLGYGHFTCHPCCYPYHLEANRLAYERRRRYGPATRRMPVLGCHSC